MGGKSDTARLNMRVQEVLDRYRQAIESVYPEATAALHLAHTNKVIITNVDEMRTLIVYVDESLFAAELNAQRELIRLRLLELFGEEIEQFQIKTSRWRKYREMHPYSNGDSNESDKKPTAIPLEEDEKSFVSRTASVIEDERIRKSLEKAMTADLELKKGEKVETERRNPK